MKNLFQAKLLLFVFLLLSTSAFATTDQLSDLLAEPGSAGLGFIGRIERSPYVGVNYRHDFVPLYLYEGDRVFLHASRVGLKFTSNSAHRLDLFLDYRFEGFPYEDTPVSLAGMENRSSAFDLGLGYTYHSGFGDFRLEFLHDAGNVYNGDEFRLGYGFDWQSGRLHLRPNVTVSARSAELNNYYYGVRNNEATATRPAYQAGSGVNTWLGLYGYYELTERWRILGALGVTFLDRTIRESPIVVDKSLPSAFVGLAYDFGSYRALPKENQSLYIKFLHGKSTDCNFLPAATLRCASTSTEDNTSINGVALGKPFIEKFNGWPLDFIGYLQLLYHNENSLQDNVVQLDAYMKAVFYGFPWQHKVKTRLGFGLGISAADHVPFVELRDQARRGRNNSKILNYLDPSIDVSVGDIIGSKGLKDTYVGVGISHRSGIFGRSELLGNVNGGSNYLYSYVEFKF